jgi:putative ABC transport system permease protein
MQPHLVRSCRSLRRSPGYAALVVSSVAFSGAGCLLAVLAYFSAGMWRPTAVSSVDRVVEIRRALVGRSVPFISPAEVERYRLQRDVFRSVSAYNSRLVTARLSTHRAERVMAEFVDDQYFTTLGVRPAVGRALSEGRPDRPPEVVIAPGLCGTSLAPDTAGQTLWVNGHALVVVGVAPEGFEGASFASPAPKMWLPLALRDVVAGQLPNEFRQDRTDPEARWVLGVARLAPGVSLAAAQARLRALADGRLPGQIPFAHQGYPVDAGIFGPARAMGMSAMVLLTCVFLGGLLSVSLLAYARGATKRPEAEVLVALGACRADVFSHWSGEGAVLGVLGALAGVAVAVIAAVGLPVLLPIVATLGFMRPSASWGIPVGAMFLFLSVTCALALVVPFWLGVRPRICASSSGMSHGRFSRAVAVALLLQVGVATLFGTVAFSLDKMRHAVIEMDPGVRTRGLAIASLALTDASQPAEVIRRLADDTARGDLRGRYALSAFPPMSPVGLGVSASPAEQGASAVPVSVRWNSVDANYFTLFDIPVLVGRGVTDQDESSQTPVVVLNQSAADALWPGRNPVGLELAVAGEKVPRMVIGVAANVADTSSGAGPSPQAYASLRQLGNLGLSSLAVSAESHDLVGARLEELSQRLSRIDPSLALDDIRSADAQRTRPFQHVWALATAAAGLGVIVLIVGGVGVFATSACVLTSRSHEAAIRVALGARPIALARSFLLADFLLLGAGIVFGATGGFLVSKVLFMATLGRALDAAGPALLAASLSSLVWAASASGPVLRAIGTDPAAVLKSE